MPQSHSHWPTKHPFNKTRRHTEMSREECDLHWREYQHGHPGEPCRMWLKPGNIKETCEIRRLTDD